MGGAKSATSTTPGGAFNPQAPVMKATRATAADLQAFDRTQARNQQMAQGLMALGAGLGNAATGLGSSGSSQSGSESNAMQSQMQAEQYRKFLEMLQKNQAEGLGFMPDMPFQTRSSGEEAVYNAWANAPSTFINSAMGGMSKGFGK
jgi:F0F1-type ATP synthase membrane subunit c/vacuolar-type H+-ATPase subunit K